MERIPDYLWQPSDHPGTVQKFEYHTHYYSGTAATPMKKDLCVYLPHGYNESTKYNLMVLLPGMDMPASCYLKRAHRHTKELYSVQFQNVLDNMIELHMIDPLIIVTLPYFGATVPGRPDMQLDGNQVVRELRNDLLPFMAKNYSIYDIGDRDHFGIFGFSYTSSMVMKYVMPFCLDLFSWFGACSVFYYAFGPSIQALEEEIEKYAVNYLYVTYGDKDDARDQTRDAYRAFITGVPKLGDRSELIMMPDTGHDAKTYDTSIVNCLLRFKKKKKKEGSENT